MDEIPYKWTPSPHTADVAIAIDSVDLEGLFHAALDGLLGTLEISKSIPGDVQVSGHEVHMKAYGIEAALVDFLNECIYAMEVDEIIPYRIASMTYDSENLSMLLNTRPLTDHEKPSIGHIKAATYSDLNVEKTDDRFRAKIIFDT
jgi:SHS2 domain-containing protein